MLSKIATAPSYPHLPRTGEEKRAWEDYVKFLNQLSPEEAQAEFLRGSTPESDPWIIFHEARTFSAVDQMYTFCERRDRGETDEASDCWENLDSARATRNRFALVKYELARAIYAIDADTPRILSIGSGSARPVLETVAEHELNVELMLLDMDAKAIEFSKKLALQLGVHNISWTIGEFLKVIRYYQNRKPHIVELVGLLDYLEDKLVVRLLEKVRSLIEPGGFLIAGNVMDNQEREFIANGLNWRMFHRTPEELKSLVERAGFDSEYIRTTEEPIEIHVLAIAQVV